MRVSREQAAPHRERVVATAARLFREHGYGSFGSKEALMAEAAAHATDGSLKDWDKLESLSHDAAHERRQAALATHAGMVARWCWHGPSATPNRPARSCRPSIRRSRRRAGKHAWPFPCYAGDFSASDVP